MITLLIIGLLGISIAIGKSQPRITAILDCIVALLILFFRVIPGTADTFDWIFMIAFALLAPVFFFKQKEDTQGVSEEALVPSQKGMDAMSPLPQKESNTMTLVPIGDLLTKAWEIYKGRMWTLVVAALATALLPILSFALPFGLGFLISLFMPDFKNVIMLVSILLALVSAAWVGNWAVSAFLTAIVDQRCGIKEAFLKAKPKILAHVWLGILTGLILTGAHLLLVIPGIIFAVWFFFAPFVFIDEDVRGMDALLKSKEYVRGRWFGVCLRLVAIWLISLAVSAIPIIGQVLALFLIPFSFIYTFLIYQDLKTIRGDISFQPGRKEKVTIIATGTFGYLMPVLIVFAFMGSMFLMPFSMLKAKMTGQSPNIKTHMQTLEDKSKGWTKATESGPQRSQIEKKKGLTSGTVLSQDTKAAGLSGKKEAGEFRKTIEASSKAIESQPKDVSAYHNRAVANFRLGNYQEAVDDFTSAIKLDPNNSTLYYNRAIAYVALGKHTEAVKDGTKAIELNPSNSNTYINRGIDYIALGNYNRAMDDLNTAVKLNSKDASAYYARGFAYHKLASTDQALEDFKKSAQMGDKKARQYLRSQGVTPQS